MIDWERVAELQSEIGREGFSEVVDLFLDEVEGVVMRLGQRPDKLGEELHFLKGSAWNLGFQAFGAFCQEGERLVDQGKSGEVEIASVIACYLASKEVFMTRVAEFCSAA